VPGHPRERTSAFGAHCLELLGVDTPRLELEHVAATAGQNDALAEDFAQVRDVPLDGLRRSRRRALAPQLVDQLVAGDDLTRAQQQQGQQAALQVPAQAQRARPQAHLEWPQQ
jgi:hypothetical protein